MSGDLQTRKRKDKRRKKEDEGLPFQPNIPHITTTNNHSSNDDLNIHVHKEGGLGGGICAKLVFFVLFSALAVLIGLIITEHRGLTDVDVVDTNSKFSQIFEGWTDPSIGHHEHDHEDVEETLAEEHDEHDEEEEEEAEQNVSEEEHDEDHDEEGNDERSNEDDDEENENGSLDEDDEPNTEEDEEEQIIENDDNTAEDDDNTAEEDDNTAEDDDNTAENYDKSAEDDDNTAEDDDNTAEDDDNDEENDISKERTSYEVERELEESSEVDNIKESEENEADGDDDDDESYNTKETTEDLSEERNEVSNEKDDDEEDDEDNNKDDSDENNAIKSEEEKSEETEENISEEDKLEESEEKRYLDDSEEKDQLEESEEKDNLKESEEKDDLEESEEKDKLEESEEKDRLEESEEKDKDMDEKDRDSGIEDDDDERFTRETEDGSEETLKDVEEDEIKKTDEDEEDQEKGVKSETVNAKRDPEDENVQESSGMAVKVGVGVALLVVAHLVLCRKWRSASVEDKKESTPDLSRRNTIIVPPTFQEVEHDIKQDEEDFSNEEEEDEELSEQEEIEPRTVKEQYAKLRSTYSRSLTPEGESLTQPHSYEDENEYDEEVEEEISEEEDEEEEGDIEEDEDNDEEYDEYENEELLKRLDAKYGKLPGSDDQTIRPSKTINEAGQASKENYEPSHDIDEDFIKNNPANAVKHFEKILEKSPSSSWSVYGNALALNYLADQQRSNEILYKAIQLYIKLLKMTEVPDSLYKEAVERTVKVMRFVGSKNVCWTGLQSQYKNLIEVHKLAINRFPDDPKNYNEMAVTYLTINRIEEARAVLKSVLKKWPNDGFALVHQGFILKTADNKLGQAVEYLRKGIDTNDKGVIDGRFYFHLGDALERLGRHDEAMEVYEEGTKNKVFLSKYQRSLYNVQRLSGKPYWNENELPYSDLFRLLKQNWRKIRDEGLSALDSKGFFQDESENLRDRGEWKQFELFARGFKNKKNCAKAPFTCSVIEQIPEAKGCKRGQTKFSVMHPGTHVWPHCGPTNCRLRLHLGLKVPPNTFLRVAEETRSWKEGKLMIFDDSFEHEVWHNGTEFRLVLIVDIWHPELTTSEKRNLSPI